MRCRSSAVVMLVLLAACSVSTPSKVASSRSLPAHPVATAPESPTAPRVKLPELRVRSVGHFKLPSAYAGNIQMFGHRFVVGIGSGPRSPFSTRVVMVNVDDGRQRIVARSQWSRGLVPWAVGSGHWIAWVDQSKLQNDFSYDVLWRVWAKNLRTGRRQLLASNGHTPDPYVPEVSAGSGYVFWAEAEPDRTAREFVWRPGSPSPRTLMRHREMTPGTETATGGMLTFLSTAAVPHKGHTVGGDCWTVPLAGGRPQPLTHTALAMGCATSHGWLVWSQHIDPETRNPPPDGIYDDPYTYWARAVDGGPPRLLHRGYTASLYPVAGAGYGTWMGTQSAFVGHAVASDAEAPIAPGHANNTAVGSSASGRLFVYATGQRTGQRIVIDLVSITVH